MISDTEIKMRGLEVLIDALGEVQAERFISLVLRESFDYTIWQRKLFADKSVEEISEAATNLRRNSENQ